MFVYFIQAVDGGPVKIGKSDNPESRLSVLQKGSPFLLRIVGVCAGGYPAETQLHRWFAAQRREGEWFDVNDPMRALLNRLPSWEEVKNGSFCPELLNNERTVLTELYQAGYTLDDIGGLLNLSRARVHQLISGRTETERRRKWTWNPATKKNYITVDIHKDRSEERPEEPIQSAYDRLVKVNCGLDLVLPNRES